MEEYEEFMDESVNEQSDTIENSGEELLEEDEISSREEAFLKGYGDAAENNPEEKTEEE